MEHTFKSCGLDEYLDYWKYTGHLKREQYTDQLVALFPHLQNFLITKRIKENKTQIILRRILTVSIDLPPTDLFLNYITVIEGKKPSREQFKVFSAWFSGFSKKEYVRKTSFWVDIESFCFAIPYIDPNKLLALPYNAEIAFSDKSLKMFKMFPYFDSVTGLYKNERYINIRILKQWGQRYFNFFDKVGLIDYDESFRNRIFVNNKKRYYLNVGESINNPKWFSLQLDKAEILRKKPRAS